MKARRLFSLLTIFFLSAIALYSQSYLIPVNAPTNKYPITFTDAAQQTLMLEFDRAVTAPGTSAGWTITVGGVPVAMTGSPTNAGNFLRITLPSSITFANRLSVIVSYNPAIGTMSLTGPVEPTITNVAATNNYIGTQADFANGLYGENPPVDICAAVQNVEITSNIIVTARFRNSIHFRTPRMYTLWMYPAGTPKTDPNYIESFAGSGIFSGTQNYAVYPDNTINCTWVISVYPFVLGAAPQPILNVTNNQVFITIPNYKKDNGEPVPGTGDLGLNPAIDHPSTLFCVGSNITAFTFTDATVFDCQYPAPEPNLPNIRPRNVQFVYGTQAGAGIPNVFINVNGTPVQVTDNTGASISGVWHVNPDGSANIPGYTTPSGFFEGPVVTYLWDAGTKLLVSPMATTYPISHTGSFTNPNENAGDIFDVTLRNWGPCNPYDGLDPFNYLAAVTENSRLRLVASPPLPTAADLTICVGGTATLTATRNGTDPAGVLYWYNNADLLPIHQVAVGSPFPTGQTAVGTYNYWVREIVTAGCAGEAEPVVLTIVGDPVAPVIAKNPAVVSVCAGTTLTVSVTTPGSGGAGTSTDEYRYSTNNGGAWTIWSATVPSFAAVTGTNLIESRRNSTASGCVSNVNSVSWTVVAQPVAQAITKTPNVTDVCTSGVVSATFSGGSGGITPTDVYFSSTDGGSTWAAYTPGSNISSAVTGASRIQIRTRRESAGTGCNNSAWTTVTWNVVAQPVAQAITKSPNVMDVCTGGIVSATFSGGSGGVSPTDVYFSSVNGGTTWAVYTPGSNLSSAIAGTDRIQVRTRRESTGTGCTTTGWITVTWNVVAQPVAQSITKAPNVTSVCTGGSVSATFTGGSGGVSPTDVYFSSIDGGLTWAAYTPGANISSAVTGAARIRIRTRRESAGTGCSNSAWTTATWDVVAQPVAQSITKTPNVTDVCTGGSVSATFSGGSGGVSPTDVYFSSVDGGISWIAYTPGSNISSATAGVNRIQIRTRRESAGTGCTTTGWVTVTWNVVAQPVAQTITKTPNVTDVCTTGNVSATFAGGSGGVTPTDVYFSSIDGGLTWAAYVPGTNISSAATGANRIQIRTRRESAGTGCTTTGWNTVTWNVVAQPVAQTINKNPNLADVCAGSNVSATFAGGSGGVTPTDVYFSSIDGGGTWSAYIPGANISSAITGANRIQIRTRRESAGTGCANSGWTTATWNVVAQPVGPTLNVKTPNTAGVCEGTNVSATFNAGSGGVGCSDAFQYRFDGGGFLPYVPGTNLNTTGHTSVEIQGQRANCSLGTGCTGTGWVTLASWVVNPIPASLITGSNNVCENIGGHIYSTPPNVGRSYSWTVTGGSITAGAGTNSITVTWGLAGPGTVSLIETIIATSCSFTTPNFDVTINPGLPTVTPTISGPTDACLSAVNVTFTTTAVATAADYEWETPTGNIVTAGLSLIYNTGPLAIGSHSFRVRGRNGCGNGPWSVVNSLNIVAQPVAQTITRTPNVAEVCTTGGVSATFAGGSGGVTPTDVYFSSIDGGLTWAAYVPGTNISSAVTGVNRIQIRTRRESAGTGCTTTGWNTVTWNVVAQPVAQTITKTPNVTDVCTTGNVSATFSGGSGGVTPTDVYFSSIDGGLTWSAYIPGTNISSAITGATRIQIRTRRESAGTGCSNSAWNTVTWNVVAQPVAQTITRTPNVAEVCTTGGVSATFSGGSGGVTPTDVYFSSIDGGLTWAAYIPGNTISSAVTGAARIQIRTRRESAGTGCTTTGWVTVTWDVVAQPVAQTITKTPNVTDVCTTGDVSATFAGGSGGVTPTDVYFSSIDGGLTWSAYVPGTNISSAVTGVNRIQIRTRRESAGTGCTTTGWNTVTWNVVAQPVAQTITKTPNVTDVCTTGNVSATFSGGSGGVTPTDVYFSSIDGGLTWSAYIPGTNISSAITGATRIQIRTRRESAGTGCSNSAWNTVTWNVVAQPVAQTITRTPNVAEVCTTGGVSATFSGGSGGVTPTDVYFSSIDGGLTWAAYIPGNTISSAVTGAARIQIRTRRESAGTGCTTTGWVTVTWDVVAQPVAQTITKTPNVTDVCTTGDVSATFSGGSGGVTPTDVYFSSIDGGLTWSAYIPGTNISSAITGATRIQIRTRRESAGTGCSNSAWNTVTWNVVAQPVAQTITRTPNVAEVCTTGGVSATFSGGSGGVTPTDVYFSSIDGGLTWAAYIPGNTISSAVTGAARIQIRTRRESAGTGCTTTGWVTVTWDVVAQPVAQTITKAPNVTDVCTTGDVSATFAGGSGGVTPTDVYFSSIDGGLTWSAYVPGTNISSAVTGVNRIQIRTRRESAGTGCTTTGWNTVTWNVVAQPVAQTITKTPNVTDVCTTGNVSATFSGGSGGVTPTDVYFSSIDGGLTWSAYIPGTNISSAITGATRIQIRTRRESAGTGCSNSAWNTVTWNVVAQPVAQTITRTPNVAEVCTTGGVSATFSGGSGGVTPTDVYFSSIDGGLTWAAYIPGNTISSAVTGAARIQIRTRRESAGTGCTTTGWVTVTWDVVAQPVAQTITKAPNVTDVCTTGDVSATFAGGSGGVTPTDVYFSSIDGGATWSAYVPGTNISSAVTGVNRIQIRTRRESAGTGCSNSAWNTVTWNVVPQPIAPGLTKSPNVASVCISQPLTVITTPGSGGTGITADEYRYSTDNGVGWTVWSATVPSFAAVTGTNIIESRRTATGGSCNVSASNSVSWIVEAQPVAQTIDKLPLTDLCINYNGSATFSGGSGGVAPVDIYQSSINAGGTWAAYTPATNLSSAVSGANRIQVRTMRQSAGFGCVNTGWTTETWNVIPEPTTYAGLDDVICANETVTLSGATATNYSLITWSSSGDGFFSDINLLNPVYTPGVNDKLSGTVTLTITVNGTVPCVTEQAISTMVLTVNPLPVTSIISGPALLCENATNRVYQVVNTPGSTYTWSVPASLNRTTPNGLYFIVVNAVAGVALPGDKVTVFETLSSTTLCVGVPVELPVIVTPVIPGDDITGPPDVCIGDAGVIYSVPDHAGSTYSWVVPAGASITSADPTLHEITVSFSMALTGTISVVETSGTVCTTLHNPLTVIIHPRPVPTVSGAGPVCELSTGNVYTTEAGMTNYNWTVSAGGTITGGSGTNSLTVTWNLPGAQWVSVNYDNTNGCTAVSPTVLPVTVTPTVAVVPFTTPASTRCQGAGTVTYSTTATNSTGITYSLDAASITGGNSIGAATGAVTFVAGWSGTTTITASAAGCNGPAITTHVVTVTPTVTIAPFAPATSIRCQGAAIIIYNTTATNSTGITYSLDAASIAGFNTINSSTGAVTYAASWSGSTVITATAAGCNGPVTTSHVVTVTPTVVIAAFSPANSTRCQGAGTTTYSTTATNSTGITYSLDAASLAGGNSIVAATGAVTYVAGWSGTTTITASAAGCNGPVTTDHIVTITPTVTIDPFAPATSVRCQGAGISIYTTTALNTTGITYSLDAASIAGGNSIVAATGVVTYVAGWSGTTTITASAAGCNGPATTTHVVTVTPTVTITPFAPATSTRCQGAGTDTYTTSAFNTTGLTYSIDATSIAGGNSIVAATGVVTWAAGWIGTTTITASAAGCNGPATTTHTVTITPTVTISPFALATSTRCQGPGTVTYTTTATNSTGITYSLDAASVTGGNTIVAATGVVTYVAGWSGTTTITASAAGCNGPATTTHVVTVTPTVTITPFALATSTRCQGAGMITYTTSATNTTGLTYSLDPLSLAFGNTIVAATGEVTWVAIWSGTTTVTATATGCSGPVTTTHVVTVTPTVAIAAFTPANSTRCQGAGTTTYSTTATNSTGITYSLDAASLAGGNSIVAATGAVTYVAGWSGTTTITASAAGCNGPVTTDHIVTITPTVTIDPFAPATSVRCQGAGISIYTTTALNTTGITYSLDAASIAGGNSIVAATGVVTYVAGWSGTTTITASAAGCNGPATTTHVVTVTPTVTITPFAPATSTRCQGAGTDTYTTSAFSTTGLTYSIDATSIAGGNSIVAATGVVTWAAGWTGTTTITASAAGCNGPATTTHTVTITPTVTISPFALATSTRCQGPGTVTYTTTATNSTGITYSLDAASVTGGNTIVAATGVVTYVAGWSGTTTITASAAGCNGPATTTHVVTVTPTVTITPFALATSTRCQGAGTMTYNTTATNTTGITYTIDAASSAGFNTINGITGEVTWAAGWSGTTTITASAAGCNGPATTTHVVTITPTVLIAIFAPETSTRCQGAGIVTYTTTATNSTGITYSLDAASITGGNTIVAATGAVTYVAGWAGTTTITASAAGCNGPAITTHVVTIGALPVITLSPVNTTTCEFGNVTFNTTATGSGLTYQWWVDNGLGFAAVSDGGSYLGSTTPVLQVLSPARAMNGYIYHVVVTGCTTSVTSADATLTVNTAPELTLHPTDAAVCFGNNTTFSADGTGSSVTWRWWVNKGSGFELVIPDVNFSGETTKTLTVTNANATFNNWLFRAVATGICGVPATTNFGRLSVTNPPAVTLNPVVRSICENGSTTFVGNGSGYLNLRWQVFSGGIWSDITDDGTYNGSGTNQLTILNAPVSFNGYQYRLGLIGSCTTTFTLGAALTVHPNPVVDFTAIDPIEVCGDTPININGNPAGGTAPYIHRWTGDIGPLSNFNVQSPVFNSQIAGDYNLNYRVTDSFGCYASDDVVVKVEMPTASFTADKTSDCQPLTVNLTNNSTDYVSVTWDFGDGNTSSVVSPSHTYSNPTTSLMYYDLKLTVTSAGGCTDDMMVGITVYPEVSSDFTIASDTICSGEAVMLSSLPGAYRYYWNYGDGVQGYGANVLNHAYVNTTSAPVTYNIKLTTTSYFTCTSETTKQIVVYPTPVADFIASPWSQVYPSTTVAFTNTSNAGSWNWLWNFGDGTTSVLMTPTHVFPQSGEYNVGLYVSNAMCTDSMKHMVSILPIPPVAAFDSIQPGCMPLAVTMNNTSLYGNEYLWDFGDGGISTSRNPSYTYYQAGTYRVTLTVKGPGGTSVNSRIVNVYQTPRANFDVAPTLVFVNDEMVRGFNLSQYANTYIWEFGDGDTSHLAEPFHKYMEEGVYPVTLHAYSDKGCYDVFTLTPGVTVQPAGDIRFSTAFRPHKEGPVEIDGIPPAGEVDNFFYPGIQDRVIKYKLQIFNRLGVLIFESDNINRGWNGYYNGQLCQQGVYVWYVEGKYANGKPFKKVGDVTLLH